MAQKRSFLGRLLRAILWLVLLFVVAGVLAVLSLRW